MQSQGIYLNTVNYLKNKGLDPLFGLARQKYHVSRKSFIVNLKKALYYSKFFIKVYEQKKFE